MPKAKTSISPVLPVDVPLTRGKTYRHIRNGHVVTILCVTNNYRALTSKPRNYPVSVVYVNQAGMHWSCPVKKFQDTFKPVAFQFRLIRSDKKTK